MGRAKNIKRNFFFGAVYKIVTLVMPFAVRTVMIYSLGSEYTGLNGLFSSILGLLSLAELGIGNVIVFSMYEPVAQNDIPRLRALVNFYKKAYRNIGIIMLSVGLVLLPFLRLLVKGEYPSDTNPYILYLVFLSNSVIGYLFWGYKQAVIAAYQRNDLISKTYTVVQLVTYTMQIMVLVLFRDYYYYVVLIPVSTIICNVLAARIADCEFPMLKRVEGHIATEERKRITKGVIALIGTRLSSTVLHSSDNIVISLFLGLPLVAYYENYMFFVTALLSVTSVLFTSMTASIGNSIVVEDKAKNYDDYKLLSIGNEFITGIFVTCLICLAQSAIVAWVGEGFLLSKMFVIILGIYYYLYSMNSVNLLYKDAAGLWWNDRMRPYVVMITNLAFNVLLVNIIGINGVILSTVISMLIALPWCGIVVNKYLFNISVKNYFCMLFIGITRCIVIMIIIYNASIYLPKPNNRIDFLINACIIFIGSVVIYFAVFSLDKKFRKLVKRFISSL